MSINELSRTGLSRCSSARCVVITMGALAEQYGFYGAGSFEGTAESLLVGDPKEVWVFHILPDDKGVSAIWVAQRVPDDHFTGVFNMFTIRAVDLTDTTNFLGSKNMFQIAIDHGFWDGKGKLDFTGTFSAGEYAHKYYSGRRFWGAMMAVAPSLKLNATYGDLKRDNPFPWSVKPDQPLNATMLMAIHRNHYKGTPYDPSNKLLAGGPHGDFVRYKANSQNMAVKGSWERTITLFRTTYSFINQAKSGRPGVVWFGPHAAHGTVYVPILSTATSLPQCLTTGSPQFVDRKTSWWAHRFLANQARLYTPGYYEAIKAAQTKYETIGAHLVETLSRQDDGDLVALFLANHANEVMTAWWQLSDTMMAKFADGFLDQGEPIGFPNKWLTAVGYQNGPTPVPPHANTKGYRNDWTD